ncbi:MAG: sensor histidine kinase [Chitinophagales bacterium]
MRLFAKIFFCTTFVLSMALSLSGYLLITSSYKYAINREKEQAFDEYQYNKFSVQAALIRNKASFYDVLPFDYGSQAALFAEDKSLVFSNLPPDSRFELLNMVSDDTVRYRVEQIGSKQYIMVCGRIIQSGKTFYLLVASDISSVSLQKEEMIRDFGRVYFSTLCVSMLLIFVLAAFLTRPIKRLTIASVDIAKGQYSRRIPVSSGDEIGELSNNFNLMADAIEEKVEELSVNAQQKEDFVANFAHELKTPLTSVIGYADMIYQKDLSHDDVKSAARYILDEGLRLEALSLKLMELIVLNRQDFVLEIMSAHELLEDIVQTLKPLFTERAVNLLFEADPAYIRVDYDLFKTLIINLIDNSIKAGSTEIIISGRRYDRQYCVSIADNGRGIPAHEVEHITEAFYMVDKSRSRKQFGAGLGLALASRIAEIHGTTLEFTSQEHQGTLAEINLPCEESEIYE